MSSVTSSTSSYMPNMMQGPGGGPRGMRQRPEASEVAEQIFSKLDTDQQGYLEADDFASAISQLSRSGQSGNTASSDEVFSSLDSDSDGKVTQDELTSGIKSLQEQLDSQFNAMRMQGGMQGMGGGGMPPPPPGGRGGQGKDQGLDQSQLGDMATAAAESGNTQAASLFSQLADNFDEADADGDGKVSFSESVAYQRQQEQAGSSDSSTSNTSSTSSASGSQDMQGRIAQRLMEMMRAYDDFSAPDEGSSMRSAA